jgi:hypothetical protein
MGFRVLLRIVQNSEIALKIRGSEGRLSGKRMIGSQANHKAIPSDLFNTYFWMLDWQRRNCDIDFAGNHIVHEVNGIGMRRADQAVRKELPVNLTGGVEHLLSDQSSATEAQSGNPTFMDRDQGVQYFISCLEKPMSHWGKSGTRWRHQYVVVRALLVEKHIKILLELIGLGAEVWSRRVQNFSRSAHSAVLDDCRQV